MEIDFVDLQSAESASCIQSHSRKLAFETALQTSVLIPVA